MILPNGRRKSQVSQGAYHNSSIYDSDLFGGFSKFSQQALQNAEDQRSMEKNKPENGNPAAKDLKMNELQETMNQSNTLPGQKKEPESLGEGAEFIDISKRISQKVIDALGLNKRPGENWQGKTEISNDGQEVVGITIKLTRAEPKDMMTQQKVTPNGPAYGERLPNKGNQGNPGNSGMGQGTITRSV